MGDDTVGYAIIDCMLNLPLLYWATEYTGDARYAAIAKAHADTAEKEFFKPDGSVYHIVDFDHETGEVKGYPEGQGYASGSSWSRGQAWAAYGFVISYIHTGEPKYLAASKRVCDYIIDNMKDYAIPPIDYMQPEQVRGVDASAGAITACGMLELGEQLGAEGQKYIDFAFRLLEGLYEDCDFGDTNQALIQSATNLYHSKNWHNPMIYADYFLLEALSKCIGKTDFFMW